MADDETPTPADPADGAKKQKEPRGMDTVIMRELRRARKLGKDGAPTDEATFIVEIAHVLALVDVAAAIRETAAAASAP